MGTLVGKRHVDCQLTDAWTEAKPARQEETLKRLGYASKMYVKDCLSISHFTGFHSKAGASKLGHEWGAAKVRIWYGCAYP